MKLRQVALAATELEPTRSHLFKLLGLTQDYADPGVGEFGLVNSVMAIGDTFLEIVAPNQSGTAAGRLLDRRGDTSGYMVLMQVESYADFARHLEAQQARKVWEVERAEVSACHVHPKDIGAAIVSFDEMRPPQNWLWAGPGWTEKRASGVRRIVGCKVQSTDPASLAQRWGELMQTVPQLFDDALRLRFSDGTYIDFVAGEGFDGVSGIIFESDNPRSIYERAKSLGLATNDAQGGGSVIIGGLTLRFVS